MSKTDCFFCKEPMPSPAKMITAQYCGDIRSVGICMRCATYKPLREILAAMFRISPREVMALGFSKQTMFHINTPTSRRQARQSEAREARA